MYNNPLLGGGAVRNNGVLQAPSRLVTMCVTVTQHLSCNYFCNPSHFLFRLWKFIVLLAVVIVSWTSMYLVCFTSVHEVTSTLRWIIEERTMFGIFFIDLLVSLNTPYVNKNTNSEVFDRCRIFKNYWSLSRVIDLIVSFPVFVILRIPLPIIAIKFWISLRLFQTRKLFAREIPKLAFLCFITLFSIHSICCVFYWLSKDNPNVKSTWINLENDESANETTWIFPYVMSFYWATASFTTVGYGDIHPVNGIEMAFCCGVMLLGACVLTYVSDGFMELVRTYRKVQTLENQKKAVGEFSTVNGLSEELREEMVSYLTRRGIRDDDDVKQGFEILSLLSSRLQSRIKANLFTEHLQTLYLFKEIFPAFLFQLVAELKVENFEQNEVVVVANEFPEKFYIGWRGGVAREINGASASEAGGLGVYGEVGVLCFVSQPYTFRTTSSSVLLSISRSSLMRLLELHERELNMLLENVLVEVLINDLNVLTNTVVEQCFQAKNIIIPTNHLRGLYTGATSNRNLHLLETVHRFSGRDLNIAITGRGDTPLHMSISHNFVEGAQYLLQSKARYDIKDSDGWTAWEKAMKQGSDEMKELFYAHCSLMRS